MREENLKAFFFTKLQAIHLCTQAKRWLVLNMSVAGLRDKHIRAMKALEEVVRENQEMKAQLKILKGSNLTQVPGINSKLNEDAENMHTNASGISAQKKHNKLLQKRNDEQEQEIFKLQQRIDDLSNDLNKETKCADEERE